MNSEVDGAAYLRRLKQDEPGPQAQVQKATDPMLKHLGKAERRATPRYKCQGSAQVRVENSDVRAFGSISDISLHGCYVEMPTTYPVGTLVALLLELGGHKVEVKGEVRATYSFLGMGIKFGEITAENRLRLGEMVLMAGREVRLAVPHPENNSPDWAIPQIRDPKRIVDALGSFFLRRASLSREEFTRMANSLATEG
jgi:PilZ domain